MNFFSGHNMAMNIMGQTSLPMQMREYQNDVLVGRDRCVEHYPERLNVGYETTKPFLPAPEPTLVVKRPEFESTTPLNLYSSRTEDKSDRMIANFERAREKEARDRMKWARIASGNFDLSDFEDL